MHTATPIIDRINSVKPWYTQLWPWLLISGPFLVVIASLFSAWLAYTREDAMVVEDYYKRGNAINQELRRDSNATHLGLSFNARYDAVKGNLTGNLLSLGQPLATAVTIRLAHATQPEKDKELTAQVDQQGNFVAPMPFLDIGRWQVTVESKARDWRLSGEWQWPQQQEIVLKADLPPVN